MNIMERYIYAVVIKLPLELRAEVEKDVKSLIYDMMDHYQDNLTEAEKLDKALKKLGDPEILADNYRGEKRYLIGPRYFDKYMEILKIVLATVFLGITVAIAVQTILNPSSIVQTITNYITSIVSGLMQGAVWVTILFVIIENTSLNREKNKTLKNNKVWRPSDLPKIPNEKTRIKPLEGVFGIIVSTVFFVVLYFIPEYVAAYIRVGGDVKILPLFNIQVIDGLKLLILGMFGVSISKECIKLIWGKWTIKSSVLYAILSLVSVILWFLFILSPGLINLNFINYFLGCFDTSKWSMLKATNILNLFLIVVVVGTLLEVVGIIFKSIKYSDLK